MFTRRSLHSLRKKFIRLNLFKSQSTDPIIIHDELLSTRLYIITILISICIVTVYVSINERIQEDIIYFPKFDLYKKLQEQYSDTLRCPCRKLAIPYGTFVNIIPSFHQVCSSHFISQLWIDFVFQTNRRLIWPMDIRTSLSAMWQLIADTCSTSTKLVFHAFNEFLNLSLINSMVLSEDLLERKIYTNIDLTFRILSNSSMKMLRSFEKISISNGLITGLSTNYILRTFSIRPGGKAKYVIPTVVRYILPGSNTICTCMHSGTCPMSGSFYLYDLWETSGLYDLNKIISNKTISGIIVDCTPLQMVLASSLECFYNQSCINLILSIYSNSKYINITILNQFLPSRFLTTTKIKYLIENIFLEKIFNETRYNDYYDQCAPLYCSYTYQSKFDGIYILTIIMSFYGGLSVGLRMIIPLVINLISFFKRKWFTIRNRSEQNQRISIKSRFLRLLIKIKVCIIEFNLYNNHSEDPLEIEHERISTRLYLIFIFCTIVTTTIYISVSIQTKYKTVLSPLENEYEQLEKQYSNTLKCPCTNISIPYKEFISIDPIYHQLCQSDFVQRSWYESFPISEHGQWSNILFIGSLHFRTLSTLCDLAKLTIIDESHRFTSTMLINGEVFSHDLFNLKLNTYLNKFINSTRMTFSNMMLLINRFIHVNQYLTGLETNFQFDLDTSYVLLDLSGLNRTRIITSSRYEIINRKEVYCAQNASTMIWGEFNDVLFEALRTDCWIVNSVLESSLACWYNYTCIDKFRQILSINDFHLDKNITILNLTTFSRFPFDVRVKTLINEIMVEQWNYSISYTKYYNKCRPIYCLYNYEKRANIWDIITIVISLFGSLNLVSWLIIPPPVKIILKLIRNVNSNNSTLSNIQSMTNNQNDQICVCIKNSWKKLWLKLLKMNLFSNGSTDIHMIWRERLSTRFYLFFMIIGLSHIILFTFISKEKFSKNISIISENEYENLILIYNRTIFQCPCRDISIPYKDFIRINNTFHQVCQSDFVNEKWMDFLFVNGQWKNYDRTDFRSRGAAYFHLLSDLCEISKIILKESIEQFLDDVFISNTLISQSQLNIHMNTIIDQFKLNIPIRFSHNLQQLRDLTHGNTFISGYFLNWYWWLNDDIDNITIPINPIILENGCSCGTRKDCLTNGSIYDSNSKIQYFQIPGWNIACSVVETLLSSTFQCFYNQTCINTLNYYIQTIHPQSFHRQINVTSLNSTLSSRFTINTFIHHIVNNLFIEEWKITLSYDAFYKQCNPTYCSYSTSKHNDFLYIISRILMYFGGLATTLRFIIPYSIDLGFKIKSYCCCRYRIAYFA